MHICYGYGIPANIEWKATLGAEWRQYEKFFPALAKSRIDQVSLECINSHVPMSVLKLLDGKDVLVGAIDVATDTHRNARGSRRRDRQSGRICSCAKNHPLHKLRHGADAPRNRRIEA